MAAPLGNQYALGNSGKPPKYMPEELEEKIVEYFKYVDDINKQRKLKRFEGEKLKPFTISGICVFLDISMETWAEYSKKQEYAEPIKRAKSRVMNHIEEGMMNGTLSTIGSIFNLKNNFGWVDKIEVNTTTSSDQLNQDDIQARINELKKKQNKAESIDTSEP
jgi:hypothetical protein